MSKNKLRLTLKNNICELRIRKALTQQQLADEIGVTRATIHAIEKGNYNPSLELAFLIAKFFNKKIEYIFYSEEDK